jgi:hypothetical protein
MPEEARSATGGFVRCNTLLASGRQWLACPSQNLNIACELRTESIRLSLEIESSLKIKPKAWGVAKKAAQSKSSVGRNCAFPVNDLVDTSSGHA